MALSVILCEDGRLDRSNGIDPRLSLVTEQVDGGLFENKENVNVS
jgi:hypothetical protein